MTRIATLFRVRKADDRSFALFPTMPDGGGQCVVFMGGFSSRGYFEAIDGSRSATAFESACLLRDLHGRGYRLRPIQSASVYHHLTREQEAARLRQRLASRTRLTLAEDRAGPWRSTHWLFKTTEGESQCDAPSRSSNC